MERKSPTVGRLKIDHLDYHKLASTRTLTKDERLDLARDAIMQMHEWIDDVVIHGNIKSNEALFCMSDAERWLKYDTAAMLDEARYDH